jgi:hypothetical protein
VATETAKFALELDDGISASASSAENALQALQAQIDKDSKALSAMKKAMREMQAGGSVDVSAYRRLKGQIDATQDSISKARASFVNLGGDFTKTARRTSKLKIAPDVAPPKGLQDMLSATNALPGPLGAASRGVGGQRSMVTGLTGAVGLAGTAALGVVAVLVALVAILAAVAVATARATAALLRYAAAQSDAMRSERLRLEGLGSLRRWMRLTATDAAQMSESINRVSARVPLARSQVAEYGEELHRLGIRGRGAEDALEALSIAQAVQGDRGRQRMMMLVRMAGHSEKAMANLSERVRRELGGVAAMRMRSLSMLATKLRESLAELVSGVNIEPLLAGLHRLSQLLSQNTDSGRGLRAILSTVLGVFIGEASDTVLTLEYMAKELVILALKIAIGFFRVRNAIEGAFGRHIIGRMMASKGAAEQVRVVLIALAAVAVVLAAGVAFLVFVLVGLITPFLLFAVMVRQGYLLTMQFLRGLDVLRAGFSSGRWAEAGANLVTGIITGMKAGVARLRAAVTSLASGALDTFRSALGIHSPSTVFAQLGLAIPQGVAEGIESGATEATGAASNMVSTATTNVSQVGGPSRSVTVGEIHIHVGAGEGGEDTARRVTDALRDFFDTGMAMEVA